MIMHCSTGVGLDDRLWSTVEVDIGSDESPDGSECRQDNCEDARSLFGEIFASLAFFLVRLLYFTLQLPH